MLITSYESTHIDFDMSLSILESTNSYLDSTIQEYNLDLDLITEGFFSSVYQKVKGFFKWVIGLLVKLWKKLVSFVKWVINKIKDAFKAIKKFFTKEKDLPPREFKIKATRVTISQNGGKSETRELSSKNDIAKYYQQSIADISQVIDVKTKEQIELVKRFEREYKNAKGTNEGYDPMIEKVIFNGLIDGTSKEYRLKRNNRLINEVENRNNDLSDTQKALIDSVKQDNENLINGSYDDISNPEGREYSVTGDTFLNYLNNKSPFLFDTDKAKAVVKSENFLEDYLALLVDNFKKLKDYGKKSTNENILSFIYTLDVTREQLGLTDEDIFKYIGGRSFNYDFEDVNYCKQMLQLRINYNNAMINALRGLVKSQYELFDVCECAADIVSKNIKYSNASNYIRSLSLNIMSNINQYMIPNTYTLDLSRIGMGVLSMSEDIFNNHFLDKVMDSPEYFSEMLYSLIRYDFILLSHGNGIESTSVKKIEGNRSIDNQFGGKITADNGEIIDTWSIQDVPLGNGTTINTVHDWIKFFVEPRLNSVKKPARVLIMSCNPHDFYIDPKTKDEFYKKRKDMVIQMSKSSTLF